MAHPQLPQKYKAVIYDKPGSISTKVVDLDMPEPGPGEVLLNLTHSGVCHSDLGVMMNSWAALPFPTQPGQVGGHEGVGKIVKMGAGTESAVVKLGDRVGIKWINSACLSCDACLAGQDGVCFNQKVSGYYCPGTFQQYVIAPANYVTPIPDGLESAQAAPFLCAGVTTYAALKKSGTQGGNWVVILGAGGGLGTLAVQFARHAFALRVIGVDAAAKKELVLSCGAEHFVGLEDTEKLADTVKGLTGGLGAHAVLVLTGVNQAYAESVDLLRFGGTLACVGIPEGEPVAIKGAMPQFLIAKAMRIIGVAVGNRQDAIECLDFAARGVVKAPIRLEKMDKLTEVFGEMRDRKLQGRVVLDLSG